MKRSENKVVIITGGALGIGRETSLYLAPRWLKNWEREIPDSGDILTACIRLDMLVSQ